MLQSRLDHFKVTNSPYVCNTAVNTRRSLRCQAGAASAQPADLVKQLLTRRSYAPPRYVGPIEVSRVPGALCCARLHGLLAAACCCTCLSAHSSAPTTNPWEAAEQALHSSRMLSICRMPWSYIILCCRWTMPTLHAANHSTHPTCTHTPHQVKPTATDHYLSRFAPLQESATASQQLRTSQ